MALKKVQTTAEAGAVSLTILAILPFIAVSAVVVMAIFIVLRTQSDTQHICRKSLMRVEQKRLDGLHRLMLLNVRAKVLRMKRQKAEIELAIATAANPAGIPAAQAKLMLVHKHQLVLSVQQKKLIFSINFKTRVEVWNVRTKLQSSIIKSASLFGGTSRLAFIGSSLQYGPLAIEARPAMSLTPDYFPAPQFTRRQVVRVQWQFRPIELLPQWMKVKGWGLGASSANSPIGSLKLRSQCATTAEPIERSEKWRARLEADKPSSS